MFIQKREGGHNKANYTIHDFVTFTILGYDEASCNVDQILKELTLKELTMTSGFNKALTNETTLF